MYIKAWMSPWSSLRLLGSGGELYLPGPQMVVPFINATHFALEDTNKNMYNSETIFKSKAYLYPLLILSTRYI